MQRQRKEQGEQTRRNIIDVTARLFSSRGYAGTSLDLIAKEAKTSKSSIFWHFTNKEDLLFTVVDHAMSAWETRAGAEILAQPDPARQLSRLIELYQELATAQPDTLRLLLGLLLETADNNPEVKKRFQRMYLGYRTSIRMIVEHGQRAGDFQLTVPPDHLATLVLSLFDGLFVQALLEPEIDQLAVFSSIRTLVFQWVMPGRAIPTPLPRASNE